MNEPTQSEDTGMTILQPGIAAMIARADIDGKIATAKAFPRNITDFLSEAATMATQTASIAASCEYSIPRDKKKIKGISVRLAEILVAAYGNLQTAARIVEIGEKTITAQGVCHDLQRNVSISIEVTRSIITKEGKRYGESMIATTCGAAISIAWRNAALKVIPNALSEEVAAKARETASGDKTELAVRVRKMIDAFGEWKISLERILAERGRQSERDLDQKDITELNGYYVAIQEGENAEMVFPLLEDPGKVTGVDALTEKLKEGK